MTEKQFDAEEARAHIILLRDGLEEIDIVFEKTKFIPNKYIKKYSRITTVEDIPHIAYTAHILAIQTFPVNSSVNFFGWAGHTIRREIVNFVRSQKKYRVAAEHVKKSGAILISRYEHPEQEYLAAECASVLNTALNSLGVKNKRAVMDKFINEDSEYNAESYFKRQKRVAHSLARLSTYPELRDYL